MKTTLIFKVCLAVLISGAASAATVKPFKDIACPDAWAFTDKTIPVIISSMPDPWGVGTDDQDKAKIHLSTADVVESIDVVPVTNDDLVMDKLTVASECLVWRNLMVDGAQYYPPAGTVERKVSNGWIPATF